MERLQKVIAEAGYTSRRKAEELIRSGKVSVNGEIVTELGTKVKGDDLIAIDGVMLTREEKVYFLLHKPNQVICSVKDEVGRTSVVDLVPCDARIYPVGRLDYDTTGLIILTNDGELANILMHPSHEVPKKYVARLNKIISKEDLQKVKQGVIVDRIRCVPSRVKLREINKNNDTSTIEITINEGRNHIVRKIFANLGYKVERLKRVEYGFLNLDNLSMGEYRRLTIKEVKKLYQYK